MKNFTKFYTFVKDAIIFSRIKRMLKRAKKAELKMNDKIMKCHAGK